MRPRRPTTIDFLVAVALIICVRETESKFAAETSGHPQPATIEQLFDDIWNGSGVFRVDQHRFFNYHPEPSEQWAPIQEDDHASAEDHQKARCDAPVPEYFEALTINGRTLVSMLIERLSSLPKSPPDGTNPSSEIFSEKEHRQRLLASEIKCLPRFQRFSSGKWILRQVESVVDQTELPLSHSHFMLALPLQDLEDTSDTVWMMLNKQIMSPQKQLTESVASFGQNPNEGASRWLVISYYLSIENETEEPPPPFCKGMPMVMFMGGFQRSLTKEPQSCLNYFFPTWKLLNVGQLKGAMIYSFLLALLTEGLFAIRAVVLQHVKMGQGRKTLLILLYMLQQTMGYVIMLVAMMYSVELFISVVLGLAVGNRLFVRGDAKQQATSSLIPSASLRTNRSQSVPPQENSAVQNQDESYNQATPELNID